ncbi:protein kinase domain protein [Ichthyophthirius multifiliis]|uniref:Protein kinase domain protein n=1 Tax=Ichthyophthirius multifiliis TaxID=5932 RepID=G0QXZ9_ICHMU|nr:protein kinase domain protein [Ichthyophthirius multifiliis]EGR29899.1 protein kinase domain protein [Ichthyophthirius multifiliis]|eukprot:XP_004031135.1 protein kinase domain protein [Ichthyophthirius multifiliis]
MQQISQKISIKDYQLPEQLSSTAHTQVYKCKKDENYYAIKIILTKEAKKRAIKEINVLKKLKGKLFIIQYIEHFEYNDNICFITEYFPSITLLQYLVKQKQCRLQSQEALFIFRNILDGLRTIHTNNLIHRNIKLDNILINEIEKIPQICGFGISKALNMNELTWSLFGSLSFTSVEILFDTPYNYKTDIWSLGVVLFALTCGQLPFGSEMTKQNQLKNLKKVCTPLFLFKNVKNICENLNMLILVIRMNNGNFDVQVLGNSLNQINERQCRFQIEEIFKNFLPKLNLKDIEQNKFL